MEIDLSWVGAKINPTNSKTKIVQCCRGGLGQGGAGSIPAWSQYVPLAQR